MFTYAWTIALALPWPATATGDGVVMDSVGRYVAETRQDAFIEWNGGKERLYVATRTETSDGPTLWIVPVPGDPGEVAAEPAEKFPTVAFERSATRQAERELRSAIERTALLDTGLVLSPVLLLVDGMGRMGTKAAGGGPVGIDVHSHVERLGMVVEVLTARSTSALDGYLTGKGLKTPTSGIAALRPYLGSKYVLVCGWTASAATSAQARCIRIDFPSPAVYYPMRPTGVYESAIPTTVWIRGFFHPSPAMTSPPGCAYSFGRVAELGAGDTADRYAAGAQPSLPLVSAGEWEPMTRVFVGNSPRDWDEDLLLVAGAPAAVRFAHYVQPDLFALALQTAVGAVLCVMVCRLGLLGSRFGPIDWLWAAGAGAAICLSTFASAYVFCRWFKRRQSVDAALSDSSLSDKTKKAFAVGIAVFVGLAALLFMIALDRLISTNDIGGRYFAAAAGISLVLVWLLLFLLLIAYVAVKIRSVARWRGLCLPVFAGLHLIVCGWICLTLRDWIYRYAN